MIYSEYITYVCRDSLSLYIYIGISTSITESVLRSGKSFFGDIPRLYTYNIDFGTRPHLTRHHTTPEKTHQGGTNIRTSYPNLHQIFWSKEITSLQKPKTHLTCIKQNTLTDEQTSRGFSTHCWRVSPVRYRCRPRRLDGTCPQSSRSCAVSRDVFWSICFWVGFSIFWDTVVWDASYGCFSFSVCDFGKTWIILKGLNLFQIVFMTFLTVHGVSAWKHFLDRFGSDES